MTLYIATSNPGKLRDFAVAADDRVAIEPLPGLKDIPAPPEDEPTFEGNARAKAIYYSQHAPDKIVLADDSGLEVDALDGAPGVRSARYAEDCNFPASPNTTTDERNNQCLLAALVGVPERSRHARYHAVLTAARDGQIIATAHGKVEGEVLDVPRGTYGFGYDPLFYLPEEGTTMAELDTQTKLAFSHRGRALTALLTQLLS